MTDGVHGNSKYKPEYCEQVIALGKEGKSPAEMCAHFDISRQTIDNWAETHPDFLEAYTRAKVHCQAWWEKTGRESLFMDKFNAPVWKKSMEARFREDYTERQEHKHDHTLRHEDALSELE
jgi:hypothetical protein